MTTPLPQLQSLLLNLLSTQSAVAQSTIDALAPDDWLQFMTMAREHRLLPLLHWRLDHERAELRIPDDVRITLARGFQHAAIRSLQLQRELLLAHRSLENAGIPHLALKGAFLAVHAYPHPALRPMRDLDILVPETMALKAYQTLLDAGFRRHDKYPGDLQATLQTKAHLPPLRSSSDTVCVELHARFTDPDRAVTDPDAAENSGLWRRAITLEMANDRLSYLSPTELLLHLIEHAVYRHRFDNGPLTLTDIAYLLNGYAIDWPLFWQMAGERQQIRGGQLLLKMVELYFGKLPMAWHEEIPAWDDSLHAMMRTTALLMLRDMTSRPDTYLEYDVLSQQRWNGKLRVFTKRLFPPKKNIASRYPVRENSVLVYPWYFVRAWHLLVTRLPEYLANRRKVHLHNEAWAIVRLNRWLQEQEN